MIKDRRHEAWKHRNKTDRGREADKRRGHLIKSRLRETKIFSGTRTNENRRGRRGEYKEETRGWRYGKYISSKKRTLIKKKKVVNAGTKKNFPQKPVGA